MIPGCGNYQQLRGTTSLRGLVNGVLTVEVLGEQGCCMLL